MTEEVQDGPIAVYGLFKDNEIILDDGEIISCITYGSVRKVIEGKVGFFLLTKKYPIQDWIISEYVLVEE